MKAISNVFVKWIVSYAAVLFAIMLMPVFLITKDASVLDSMVNYLFSNKS